MKIEIQLSELLYLAVRLSDNLATKDEADEFMLLLYETNTIDTAIYMHYKTGSDIPWAIDTALLLLHRPTSNYFSGFLQHSAV